MYPYMLSYTSQEQYTLLKVYSCIVPFSKSSSSIFLLLQIKISTAPEHTANDIFFCMKTNINLSYEVGLR
jgi:hypothetical protein